MDRKKRISVICEVYGDYKNDFIVELFDYDNTPISKKLAYNEEVVTFHINKNKKYKIIVSACDGGKCISPASASRWLIFIPQKKNIFYFKFNNTCSYKWLLKLTDEYYPDLKIATGSLLVGEHEVTIKDGIGCCCLCAGTYTVKSNVYGYYGKIIPSVFSTTCTSGTQSFTICAIGKLTLKVNNTGVQGGVPITQGLFIRCDETGKITYGAKKEIDDTGHCVFNNVPFGIQEKPYVFYVKQLKSDGEHSIHPGVITVNMKSQQKVKYVENPDASLQTFTLTDGNYQGLGLDGTLTFEDT